MRTKRTARMSTGGRPPRVQLSTRPVNPFADLTGELFGPPRDGRTVQRRRLESGRPSLPTVGAFEARFGLARNPTPTTNGVGDDDFRRVVSVVKDDVLAFLGPHEVLAFLRSTKRAWHSTNAERKRAALLRSAFAYLRVSDEAAEHVEKTVRGGWSAFLPRLLSICEDLSGTYGHLEPDPAHRAIVAEQAIFSAKRPWRLGELAGRNVIREVRRTRERGVRHEFDDLDLDLTDDGDFAYPSDRAPADPLPLRRLRSVGRCRVCWGDPNSCLGDDDGMVDWLERNLRWMKVHAGDAPNEHYKARLERGLHHPIWIMYDNGAERVEWAMGIGPDREQFVENFSSYYSLSTWEGQRERQTETFWSCFDHAKYADGGFRNGGFVEFLVSYPCAADPCLDAQPSLNMGIWCMRHGLEPFTDKSIDWAALIQGSSDAEFLREALTAPSFGLADFKKFVGNTQESSKSSPSTE